MPAVSQLATRILWSWIIAATFFVLAASVKAPVRAGPPEVKSTDVSVDPEMLDVSEVNRGSFQLGLLPYLSPAALMETYRPIVEYLEQRLQRRIMVLTAPDFNKYLQRADEGHYDLYYTAPHFAALAESRNQYRRLVRWSDPLHGTVVVARNSPYQRIEDLRGTTFATPDPLAVITMLGELLLVDHGLVPHQDVTMKYTPSHNNALLSVIEGHADVGISANFVYEGLDSKSKNQLRLLTRTREIPTPMFMAAPDIPESEYQILKATLLEFPLDDAASAHFFATTGHQGIIPISDKDMESLAAILPLLEARRAK